MNKLIRLYNENRFIILVFVIIIALIILVIQVLNGIVKENDDKNKININQINRNETISPSNVSKMTGEEVQNNEFYTNTIKKFVDYCNQGEVEKAYNMLTDECKKFVYTSLDKFKTLYYNRIFTEKRMYNLENWYTTPSLKTYHITYIEDILSSGNVNPERSLGDYITVENTKKENRLNIGSYIGYKDLNREEERNGIKITVNKMYMYMDYTIVDIKVNNLTKNTILLDSKEENNTLYLYDENGVRYTSFLNENAEEELKVRSQMEKSIMIKFNKMYNPTSRTLAGISFNDIVLNYDDYSNKTTSKQVTKLAIKL